MFTVLFEVFQFNLIELQCPNSIDATICKCINDLIINRIISYSNSIIH